ncbi:MAG TPA: FAD-dependent oxidoreductase [Candidatus Limnocylindria bacterium]|nr:FAD-dependent oxidoreductase [Candidatus Limnocylindria bacterium]
MPDVADAIIIGAGIHGASAAFHLAERGFRPVVLERATVASGATGRSSGLVRMHYDVETDARLAWCSHAYFREWEERIGGACGFVRTGFLQLVAEDETDALGANVAMLRAIGIPTEMIDADGVRDLMPGVAVDDLALAAWEPESGYADPTSTTNALLRAAVDRGARLVQGAAVTSIRVDRGHVVGVDTPRGSWDAAIVIDAAGAWAAAVAAMVGVDLPLEVWRHDVAYLARPSEVGPHPAMIDFANAFYIRPEGASLTLIGLEDGNELGSSPDRQTDSAAPGFPERAAARICRRLPGFEMAGLQSAHSGQDGLTPDQHPIIGPAGPDGFYLDCGFSGTGFKTAPAVGRCLAELILDGQALTVDLRPYRFERFADADLIRGEHPYAPVWREASLEEDLSAR